MGRPQFAQQGTRGSGDTVAVSDRPEVSKVNATNTSSLASGSNEQTEIYAPSGSVYFPLAIWIRCNADADATSGDHFFIFRTLGNVKVGKGRADYTGDLNYQHQEWLQANQNQLPTNGPAQSNIPDRMAATENSPMTIGYYNRLDVAQENKRSRELTVKEVMY